jgi:hypothetical protein
MRATVTSAIDQNGQRALMELPIAEIELNYSEGWKGSDISFLSNFPNLSAFKIVDWNIKSVEPIHRLHKLKTLEVITHCKSEIRFAEFPDLVECGLQWRPKAVSIFESFGLEKLFINRYSSTDSKSFGRLAQLDSLTLLGSPIQSLEGLAPLENLRFLRLRDLRRLADLNGLQALSSLERLEINTCRKLTSIEQISHLVHLQELYLNNLGDIRSLKPLALLKDLRTVTFYQSTNIVDGDLSPLFDLPRLESASFQNRRHYSNRREEFGGA